jgi:hypothetical protein
MGGMTSLIKQDIKNLNDPLHMKYIKILHTALGIIPFAWLISFLIMLIIGTIHFGYVPKYGNPIDPYALGLDWINIIELWLGFLGYLSFFIWPLLTAILYIFFRNKITLNKLSMLMFFIGITGFFIFRYGFSEAFLWVVD